MAMVGQVLMVAGVVGLCLGVIAVAFVLGMRTKSRLVQGPLVWLQRRFLNRQQMRSAGRPGAYASVIRHRGRRSGRTYETPVGVTRAMDGGFLIALPYGPRTQWLRNVLATGSATIVHEGHAYQVDRPEVVRLEDVTTSFSSSDQRSFRLFAVDEGLKLRIASLDSEDASLAAA